MTPQRKHLHPDRNGPKAPLAALLGALAAAALLLAGSCGYSSRTLLKEETRSIYIPVFDNVTWSKGFYRDFEKDLTLAVITEIRRFSRLKIQPADKADSILRGTITDFRESVVTKTEDDVIVLKRLTMTLELSWKDSLTDRDIIPPQRIEETVRFTPEIGEPFANLAFREMAERIVEKMWAGW